MDQLLATIISSGQLPVLDKQSKAVSAGAFLGLLAMHFFAFVACTLSILSFLSNCINNFELIFTLKMIKKLF